PHLLAGREGPGAGPGLCSHRQPAARHGSGALVGRSGSVHLRSGERPQGVEPLKDGLLAAVVLLSLTSCYDAGSLTGPYRCGENGACTEGLVCDDGVCCSPLGFPRCRSLVLDGGTCASGSAPQLYFQDLDGDGFGDDSATRLYCAPPV